jgi:hypothetical protein
VVFWQAELWKAFGGVVGDDGVCEVLKAEFADFGKLKLLSLVSLLI